MARSVGSSIEFNKPIDRFEGPTCAAAKLSLSAARRFARSQRSRSGGNLIHTSASERDFALSKQGRSCAAFAGGQQAFEIGVENHG